MCMSVLKWTRARVEVIISKQCMKSARLPLLVTQQTPQPRAISAQNLDSLFNALVLALNLHSTETRTTDLIAILTSMHNQFISKLDVNALELISLYKALGLLFIDMIRGLPIDRRSSFKPYDWSLAHSCPTVMTELISWYRTHSVKHDLSDPTFLLELQVVYAFLSGHRVIVTPAKVDMSTIIAPSSVDTLPNYSARLPEALQRLGITPTAFQSVYKANCANAKLRVVTTAGPNGQATWTAAEDALAIFNDRTLAKELREFATASNLGWILTTMVGTIEAPLTLKGSTVEKAPVTGRIHAIEEWGGKTRLVAILDYWSQAILTPLHDTVAHFLKRLASDGTFDQAKIISRVQKWTKSDSATVNSYDLTAATDRIPVKFMTDILATLFGDSKLANHWENVIRNRLFQAPDGSMVEYAVGQPMGAKSSFPMLGLAHHVIVQLAAMDAGVKRYSDYVILGDDNTHSNGDVARKYLEIMAALGVPINQSKSVTHWTNAKPAGEICKRVFVSGYEITTFPVKLIVKCVKFGHMISDLQNIIAIRGWCVSKANWFSFAAGLVDTRSLQANLLLNALPLEVSGLVDTATLPDGFAVNKAWGTKFDVNDKWFKGAYMFGLVSEQLKRVDRLLRGTIVMAETIATMANPDPAKEYPTALFEGMTQEQKDALILSLPKLSWTHPIVLASQNELDRVLSHLSALRAGTADMQNKAKTGLLDILRNSLSEMFLSDSERANAVTRSVINAMLGAIKQATTENPKTHKIPESLNFSLLLTSVQRMWTVHWTPGSDILLNAVKSKVNINTQAVKSRVSDTVSNFNIKDLRL